MEALHAILTPMLFAHPMMDVDDPSTHKSEVAGI